MMPFKRMLILLLLSGVAWSKEVSVDVTALTEAEAVELAKDPSRTKAKYYSSVHISYDGKNTYHFFLTDGKPTVTQFNQVLNCRDHSYITVMLQTDGSYQNGTYSNTLIVNRLYIYDTGLSLINAYESLYSSNKDLEDGSIYTDSEHTFTLDNVEEFACDQIDQRLNPKNLEKALSLKKKYNEYDESTLQLMFEQRPVSKKNVTQYNNIAYYFEKNKDYEQAVFILDKVLEKYPSRTVAYINLGDAYWGLKQTDKAKIAYEQYIERMTSNGKEDRIPQEVFDRI